jgi:TonB family protein
MTIRMCARSVQAMMGAIALAASCAHAQTSDAEFEAKVERMTDMVIGMFPVGALLDEQMARDPTWPTRGDPSVSADQLACMRNGLSSSAIRKRKLSEVQAYAAADHERFAVDYKLLESGAAAAVQLAMQAGLGGARNGQRTQNDVFKDLPPEQLLAMMTFMIDAKHKAVRDLTGLGPLLDGMINRGDPQESSVNFGRQLSATLMLPAIRACGVTPPASLTAPQPSTMPAALSADFGRACKNPIDSSTPPAARRRMTPPRPDPRSPLAAPAYPAAAKRAGFEGTVHVSILINEQGETVRAQLNKSSGHFQLDEAAVQGVRDWRMTPGRDGESAACMWVIAPVVFKLAPPLPPEPSPAQ